MDGESEGPDGWGLLSLHGFGETIDDLTVDVLSRINKIHLFKLMFSKHQQLMFVNTNVF